LSTDEEIAEVFNDDINRKSQQVFNRQGIMPFLDGLDSCQIKELYRGLLDEDDRKLLRRILDNDPEGG